jgi:hypothetical protein
MNTHGHQPSAFWALVSALVLIAATMLVLSSAPVPATAAQPMALGTPAAAYVTMAGCGAVPGPLPTRTLTGLAQGNVEPQLSNRINCKWIVPGASAPVTNSLPITSDVPQTLTVEIQLDMGNVLEVYRPQVITATVGTSIILSGDVDIQYSLSDTAKISLRNVALPEGATPVRIALGFENMLLINADFIVNRGRPQSGPLTIHMPMLYLDACPGREADFCEPNNSLDTAYRWERQPITTTLNSTGDVADFYRFVISGTAVQTLTIANTEAGVDIDLFLYDPNTRTVVCRSNFAGSSNETIYFNRDTCTNSPTFPPTRLVSGMYVLQVNLFRSPQPGQPASYQLRLQT